MQIIGKVVKGKSRGGALGFPTANLELTSGTPPEYGIYAAHVVLDGVRHNGALSVGPAYTFDETVPTVEVHLLNFNGDLYGKTLTLEIIQKIREMEKFQSIEALKDQIKKDCERVQTICSAAL